MEAQAREIGNLLHELMGPSGLGFLVTLFEFGDGGWSTYISNGNRKDMVKYLRELAAEIEGQ